MGDAAGWQIAAQTQLAACTVRTVDADIRMTSEIMRVMACQHLLCVPPCRPIPV
jgi:hypothetical protein